MAQKNKNEFVDVDKIRHLAESKYKTLENFGTAVLRLKHRQMVYERLANKSRISADELFLIADDFGLQVDQLRLRK